MLDVRSPNTLYLASGILRSTVQSDMRLQWVSSVLSNKHIIVYEVISPFAREILEKISKTNSVLVISLNQSHIYGGSQMLMLSLRHEKRAVPLLWNAQFNFLLP